jgi:ABC-type amino acid transport substrate-binding protein
MAARPWRIIVIALGLALTIWIWTLGAVVFFLRWQSVERPGPPTKELFPYGELRIGVDASYPPFAVATENDLFGLDIDLGRALGQRLGIPVRFVNMGFDGLYDSLKADQVDVLISALLVEPYRTGDVRYTTDYFNAGLMLVTNTNQSLVSMDDLPGHSLAYEFGSEADIVARSWLRRVKRFQTRPYELPEYALEAVRLGQADAALADATSVDLFLRKHPEWGAKTNYVTNAWYAAAVRINRFATWQAIDNAMHRLIDDGTLDAILKKWL